MLNKGENDQSQDEMMMRTRDRSWPLDVTLADRGPKNPLVEILAERGHAARVCGFCSVRAEPGGRFLDGEPALVDKG